MEVKNPPETGNSEKIDEKESESAEPLFKLKHIRVFDLLAWLTLINGVLGTMIYQNFA